MESQNSISKIDKKDEKQTSNQNNSNNESKKSIPIYMNLYPPVLENIDYDSPLKVLKYSNSIKKDITDESLDDKENCTYEMDNDFLESLLQRKTNLDRIKIINTISKFIRNSKLIQKLESEFRSDKKSDLDLLVRSCAKNLNFKKLNKGEILFKIGELGDRFYFILNGKVNILKLKELKDIYLTYIEYLQYLIFLIDSKEEYILNEVTKKNRKLLDITYPEDIIRLYRIVFIGLLRENILNHFIQNNKQLIEFFNNYKQKMEEFHLIKNDLISLEEQKLKGAYGSTKEWETYILKRCRPNIKEIIFFEDYEQTFKDKTKKNIICYVYESFLFIGKGLFFGDFALDSEHNRRNATIRAEEETILGWLKSVDYANMIAPKRKIEKYNEIMFLYKNFFFKHTNNHTFERKYFHLFPPYEFKKGTILFKANTNPNCLYFIKQGQISLEFKCSIFEIHFLIRKIFETLIRNDFYKRIISKYKNQHYLISENDMRRIRKYFNEPIFFKLRDKNEKFKEEMEKKIKYKLSVLSVNEIVGMEDIFLGFPHLCTSEVVSKKLICYELTVKQLNIFLDNEKNIIGPYTKSAVNKIITLIDRLQNIKKNGIYMARLKYDNVRYKSEDQNNSTNNSISINKEQINSIDKSSLNNNIKIGTINSFRIINSYYDKKSNKDIKKFHEISKDHFNLTLFKKSHLFNNINKNDNKKLIHKNLSFVMTPKEENKNNNSNIINKNIQNNNPINELKHNNSDVLLIGNTRIKINEIKKEINKFNSYDNYNPINNTGYSKLFELSQCHYPLSEERNIDFNDISKSNQNFEIKKILNNKFRNFSDQKNNTKDIIIKINKEKDMFFKKIKANNRFLNKIKIINNYKRNSTLPENIKKINIIDISQINPKEVNNDKKVIQIKELLSEIIKDYYKDMKSKGVLSLVSKIDSNTYFTRKLHGKYSKEKKIENNSNDINRQLPKIIPKSNSQD